MKKSKKHKKTKSKIKQKCNQLNDYIEEQDVQEIVCLDKYYDKAFLKSYPTTYLLYVLVGIFMLTIPFVTGYAYIRHIRNISVDSNIWIGAIGTIFIGIGMLRMIIIDIKQKCHMYSVAACFGIGGVCLYGWSSFFSNHDMNIVFDEMVKKYIIFSFAFLFIIGILIAGNGPIWYQSKIAHRNNIFWHNLYRVNLRVYIICICSLLMTMIYEPYIVSTVILITILSFLHIILFVISHIYSNLEYHGKRIVLWRKSERNGRDSSLVVLLFIYIYFYLIIKGEWNLAYRCLIK